MKKGIKGGGMPMSKPVKPLVQDSSMEPDGDERMPFKKGGAVKGKKC